MAERIPAQSSTTRIPVHHVLFDGDCGICTWFARKAQQIDRRHLFVVLPYQEFSEEGLARVNSTRSDCRKRLRVITRGQRVYSGAFGVNYFLFHYFPWSVVVFVIYALPVLLVAEALAYELVARNRGRISRWFGLEACRVERSAPTSGTDASNSGS